MAGTSLFALIDDIATILDDVSLMTRVAAKKTAGVLGDDLALNAQQVAGVTADRELPVVWAVARGSMINKVILVPAALAISAFAPWAVTPLLMIGGAYLCYEGVEKLAHAIFHDKHEEEEEAELLQAVHNPAVDLVAFEKDKIKGAVRTDFILSAEIIVIALGTVANVSFMQRVMVLSAIGVLMTVGVYGLVAAIVKLDDLGLYLTQRGGKGPQGAPLRAIGGLLLAAAPLLMKLLSVLGTAAMFMVGGGILTHGIPLLHHLIENIAHRAAEIPLAGGLLTRLAPLTLDTITGIIAGAIILAIVTMGARLLRGGQKESAS
ncbi:MAG: DUF808 domain-containing protein [Blastocatellia bacterium]